MARLTPFSRILIVAAIVLLCFFLYKKFVAGGDNAAVPETTTEAAAPTESTTDDTAPAGGSSSETTGAPTPTFDYTPPAPVGGTLKGVVELGATGFNSFIVTIDSKKNWKLEKADYGRSLVYESMAGEDDIRKGLKQYIADMLDFGVSGKEIHFVISSGAQKVEITKTIIAELKKMKYVVNTVTPQQEGILALKSVLPKAYENNSFVADIGSGNTKISFLNNGTAKGLETYGAKYFQDNIADSKVKSDVAALSKQVPSDKRNTCFIIGGVPFTLAKQVRKGEERYTVLRAPGDYKGEDKKEQSGLNIYSGIAEGTGCQTFVFDWDANFTIGFLLNL